MGSELLIGRWVLLDASRFSIIRGPAALMNGRRIGQMILEVEELHPDLPMPDGWFRLADERSIGYKLELDVEKPRKL